MKVLKSLESYIDELEMEIRKICPPTVRMERMTVTKLNSTRREAFRFIFEDSDVAPLLYPEDHYSWYMEGATLHEIAERYLSCIMDAEIPGGLEIIENYETAKNSLAVRIVGCCRNSEMLRGVPHIVIEDLALVCYCLLDEGNGDTGAFLVNNSILEKWNVSPEKLLEDAMENSVRLLPPSLLENSNCGIIEMPFSDECMKSVTTQGEMLVFTNSSHRFGASALFYPGVMKAAASAIGNFLIIPSSLHELIILPDSGSISYAAITEIIREVNREEVSEQDFLSDSLYRYEAESGKIAKVS